MGEPIHLFIYSCRADRPRRTRQGGAFLGSLEPFVQTKLDNASHLLISKVWGMSKENRFHNLKRTLETELEHPTFTPCTHSQKFCRILLTELSSSNSTRGIGRALHCKSLHKPVYCLIAMMDPHPSAMPVAILKMGSSGPAAAADCPYTICNILKIAGLQKTAPKLLCLMVSHII